MANVFSEDRGDYQAVGGGYGGFGGGGLIAMILVVLVVLWTLFKDGHGRGGYDGCAPAPYAYGGGCGPCVRPSFLDESNWEEESHLKDRLCCIDKEVIAQGCMTRDVEHCEAEKTRDLIHCEVEKSLRDKLAEKNDVIMTLKQEAFTERKIDQVLGAINCTNDRIAKVECEIPHRPPFYACGGEPTIYDYPPRSYGNNYPKRGCCDGYGNDGYGVA